MNGFKLMSFLFYAVFSRFKPRRNFFDHIQLFSFIFSTVTFYSILSITIYRCLLLFLLLFVLRSQRTKEKIKGFDRSAAGTCDEQQRRRREEEMSIAIHTQHTHIQSFIHSNNQAKQSTQSTQSTL